MARVRHVIIQAKEALSRFIQTSHEQDEYFLISFNSTPHLLLDGTRDAQAVLDQFKNVHPGGETALYDAVGLYLDGASGQDGRKIMLLYTDGGDTRSSISLHELIELLKVSDVTVYPIGLLEHQSSSGRAQQRMVLQQMADVTGGQAFFPTAIKELDGVYEKVVAEIRAQYTIGYVSTNAKTDGAWRKVEVKVKRKDVRVRARKGYFALFRKP
jgi:Ca-activated chloride channel family protein